MKLETNLDNASEAHISMVLYLISKDILLKIKSKNKTFKKIRNRIKFIERKLDEEKIKRANIV